MLTALPLVGAHSLKLTLTTNSKSHAFEGNGCIVHGLRLNVGWDGRTDGRMDGRAGQTIHHILSTFKLMNICGKEVFKGRGTALVVMVMGLCILNGYHCHCQRVALLMSLANIPPDADVCLAIHPYDRPSLVPSFREAIHTSHPICCNSCSVHV